MDYLISEISSRAIKEESSLRSDSALSILLIYLIIELDPLIKWFRCSQEFIHRFIDSIREGGNKIQSWNARAARKFMYDRGADWNALSRHRRLLWTWRESGSYRAYPQGWRSSYSSTSDEHLIHRHDWFRLVWNRLRSSEIAHRCANIGIKSVLDPIILSENWKSRIRTTMIDARY